MQIHQTGFHGWYDPWRGTAIGVFSKNLSREKQEALLDKIAQEIFADYPPGS